MARVSYNWDKLLEEYLASEYDNKTEFAKSKGINPSFFRRNTTNWPDKRRGETEQKVTIKKVTAKKVTKKNQSNVTEKVKQRVTQKKVTQKALPAKTVAFENSAAESPADLHGNTKIIMEEPKARIIETALNLGYDATVTEICQRSNVTRVTFYRWLSDDPVFRDTYQNLWRREVEGEVSGTVKAILRKAHSGDLAAARLHLEMAGILSPSGGPGAFAPTINNFIQNNVANIPATPTERQARIDELMGKLVGKRADRTPLAS